MAWGIGVPVPKGKTRKQLKARKDREDAKQLKAFRDAVWLREIQRAWLLRDWVQPAEDEAYCQSCRAFVRRGPKFIQTGEVHHRIGRGRLATRHDPANGVLLCNAFVNDCHGKAQRGEIQV